MTKKQLLAKLQKCAAMHEESGHYDADTALLDFINDEEITSAYTAVPKWYA